MSLKEQIEAKGLKQKWIAEKLEVNHITLNAYLNGSREMPDGLKKEILNLIGL